MPSYRAREINYYEELGVEPNASPAQIRDSFRVLARLLHPDQYTDPALKAMAERQMRRINEIYAFLSDAEKRRRYDADLDDNYSGPAVVVNPGVAIYPQRFIARSLWAGAIIILVVASVWLYLDNPGPAPPVAMEHAARPVRPAGVLPEPGLAGEIEALRSELRAARYERDAARYELSRLRAALETENSSIPDAPPAISPPALANAGPIPDFKIAPIQPRAAAPAQAAPPRSAQPKPLGSDPHQFAGFWFFAPGLGRGDKNAYTPQFIEAVLTEKGGVIHGTYRSRYRIVDRAISPDVSFEFTGTPMGVTLTTPWTGSGGARGQAILSLTGENLLKFDWTASELGTAQGLAAGNATLMRRIE